MRNKKLFVILGTFFFIIYPIIRFKSIYPGITLMNDYQMGLLFFYRYVSPVDNVLFFCFCYFIAAHFMGVSHLQNKKNHFSYLIMNRIGFKKTIVNQIFKNILYAFFFYILIQIVSLISITLFCSQISFINPFEDNYIYEVNSLSSNLILNLVFFILLSSIGFSIFSNFLYSLSFYIKNIFAYRASGIIFGIVLTVIPAICNYNMPDFSIFWSVFYLPNILASSVLGFGAYALPLPSLAHFLITGLFYLILGFILLFKGAKKEYEVE